MTGEIHSCGYQDSGIAHNCCKIVDSLKKRIEFCNDFIQSGSSEKPQTMELVKELQKILGEKE